MRAFIAASVIALLSISAPSRGHAHADEVPGGESPKPPPPKPPPPKAGATAPSKPGAKHRAAVPDGELWLEVGEQHRLELPGGTQVVCDDPEVVRPDFSGESLVLSGLKPGVTTCGARLNGGVKGLWKVTVAPAGKFN